VVRHLTAEFDHAPQAVPALIVVRARLDENKPVDGRKYFAQCTAFAAPPCLVAQFDDTAVDLELIWTHKAGALVCGASALALAAPDNIEPGVGTYAQLASRCLEHVQNTPRAASAPPRARPAVDWTALYPDAALASTTAWSPRPRAFDFHDYGTTRLLSTKDPLQGFVTFTASARGRPLLSRHAHGGAIASALTAFLCDALDALYHVPFRVNNVNVSFDAAVPADGSPLRIANVGITWSDWGVWPTLTCALVDAQQRRYATCAARFSYMGEKQVLANM